MRRSGERHIDTEDEAEWILLNESDQGESLAELWQTLEATGGRCGELSGVVLARGWIGGSI